MIAVAKLRGYQRSNGLTQRALAALLGVTEAQVSTWLAGKRGPSLSTAMQVEARTGGAVPASAWVSKRHARRVARRTQ